MSIKTSRDTTGLDTLNPGAHPARDAVHFRRILTARTHIADAEAELRDAVKAAREAGDSWTRHRRRTRHHPPSRPTAFRQGLTTYDSNQSPNSRQSSARRAKGIVRAPRHVRASGHPYLCGVCVVVGEPSAQCALCNDPVHGSDGGGSARDGRPSSGTATTSGAPSRERNGHRSPPSRGLPSSDRWRGTNRSPPDERVQDLFSGGHSGTR